MPISFSIPTIGLSDLLIPAATQESNPSGGLDFSNILLSATTASAAPAEAAALPRPSPQMQNAVPLPLLENDPASAPAPTGPVFVPNVAQNAAPAVRTPEVKVPLPKLASFTRTVYERSSSNSPSSETLDRLYGGKATPPVAPKPAETDEPPVQTATDVQPPSVQSAKTENAPPQSVQSSALDESATTDPPPETHGAPEAPVNLNTAPAPLPVPVSYRPAALAEMSVVASKPIKKATGHTNTEKTATDGAATASASANDPVNIQPIGDPGKNPSNSRDSQDPSQPPGKDSTPTLASLANSPDVKSIQVQTEAVSAPAPNASPAHSASIPAFATAVAQAASSKNNSGADDPQPRAPGAAPQIQGDGTRIVSSDASATMLHGQTTQSDKAAPAQRPDNPWTPPASPVARRVSIDVGEGDSRVLITIHERAGDISVKVDAATPGLHGQLQGSAGTLVEALQRQQIPLMNLDFSSLSGGSSDQQGQQPKDPQSPKSAKPNRKFAEADDDSVSLEINR